MSTPTVFSTLQLFGRWHHDGMVMGLHWGWWSFWILTVIGLVWAGWRALDDRAVPRKVRRRADTAEDVLRRRFADGEIDDEEFHRRLRALRDDPAG